ncbi:hypothetical protein GCM10028805_53270 [Spirosoma harenae]
MKKIELRAGTILEVFEFPQARKHTYKWKVDFGEFGIRTSGAQITHNYQLDEPPGKQS